MNSYTKKYSIRYFIAKCACTENLTVAQQTHIWGCQDRNKPPHPRDVLAGAFREGTVVLIFSVTGGHGWHGYASLVSAPTETLDTASEPSEEKSSRYDKVYSPSSPLKETGGVTEYQPSRSLEECSKIDKSENVKEGNEDQSEGLKACGDSRWHKFKIQWHTPISVCLPLSQTCDLLCLDKQTPVNKGRNMQELSSESGQQICHLFDEYYDQCTRDKALSEEARFAAILAPFFAPSTEESQDPLAVWSSLVGKVEKHGRVLLACASGSQRYNLSVPTSDVDMFVVYVADTRNVLSLSPPLQTIKSSETESYDYTILELFRFSELLAAGDPKCVETLFLHPSSIYSISSEFRRLMESAHLFLNRQCVEKYVRDAVGSKGCKMLDRLISSGQTAEMPMSDKIRKLLYIIVRLLQNAREAVDGIYLQVFRPAGCSEREFLMSIRNGQCSLSTAQAEIKRLRDEIDCRVAALPSDLGVTTQVVEEWLLEIRFENLASEK